MIRQTDFFVQGVHWQILASKCVFHWKKGNNMLGYKIYFNGEKFVADNTATEVQTMPCDSTVSWMANKTYADNAVEKHNANDLNDVKKCKECGEYFWQTDEERTWFADRNMKAPCRCYSCRKKKH